jgi:hypothetical protein
MKLLNTSLIAAGTSLLAVSAFAGTEAGNLELEGAGSLQYQAESQSGAGTTDLTTYQGQIGVGYFVTDAIEIKLNGVFQGQNISANGFNNTSYSIFTEAGVDYHFMTKEKIVPYVGIYGGLDFQLSSGAGSSSEVGGLVDVHAGMKQFVGERTSIDYRLSYQYIEIGSSNGGGDLSINALLLTVGVTYAF